MKIHLLCFVITFLLGHTIFSRNGTPPTLPATSTTTATARVSSSHYYEEASDDYVELLLDEEQQLHLLVDQANTLNALLGVAEKVFTANDLGQNRPHPIAEKLARLYPAEALRYYAARPTNAELNEVMERMIMEKWAENDISACLAYLDHDKNRSLADFSAWWCKLARENGADKTKEFVQAFAKLSREKQQKLIDDSYNLTNLLPHLLAQIKEPDLLAEAQQEINRSIDEESESESQREKANSEKEAEHQRIDNLIKQLQVTNPDSEQLASILREEKSDDARRIILDKILSPREEERDDASTWLTRISKVLAIIDELPSSPTVQSLKGGYLYQKELEQWLPTQSPRLQRAWADDIVSEQSKEEALAWIEGLSTASLRTDMREQVITDWSENDPDQAAEYLISKASSDEQESFLPDAIYQWALHDYAAATRWLENAPESPAKTAALKKLK